MKIIIIGAGTAASNVADIIIQDRNFEIAGFVGTKDEDKKLEGKKIYANIPFLGDRGILPKLKDNEIFGFVAAIGNNIIREKAFYEATLAGLTPINAISKHAIIEPSAKIEGGVVISSGCIVAHGVTISNNTYLGSGVIVEINSNIGENCHFYPGSIVGGKCEIGRNVTMGVRSVIQPYIKIGKNQNINAGQVVAKDLPDLIRREK